MTEKTKIIVHIETQMRAGTHYLLSNLISVYNCLPAIVTRSGNIEVKPLEFVNKGLYEPLEKKEINW